MTSDDGKNEEKRNLQITGEYMHLSTFSFQRKKNLIVTSRTHRARFARYLALLIRRSGPMSAPPGHPLIIFVASCYLYKT